MAAFTDQQIATWLAQNINDPAAIQAMATAHYNGSSHVGGVISEKNQPFANVLEKISMTTVDKAEIRVKLIKDGQQ